MLQNVFPSIVKRIWLLVLVIIIFVVQTFCINKFSNYRGLCADVVKMMATATAEKNKKSQSDE